MEKHLMDGGELSLCTFPKSGWSIIENNILTVLANDGSESTNGGDIVTLEKFSNFELRIRF